MTSELSKYINKQLKTILIQVHETPPKKSASMKKIKKLVAEAPLSLTEKQLIDKKILKIQRAFTGPRPATVAAKRQKQKQKMTPYSKNLFFENMFLQEQIINERCEPKSLKRDLRTKSSCSQRVEKDEQSYEQLLKKLQKIRKKKLKKEQYLCELIIKCQRMERLLCLRMQNQEKYLKSKQIERSYQMRQKKERHMKERVKIAAQENRKRVVHTLVGKYNQYLGIL